MTITIKIMSITHVNNKSYCVHPTFIKHIQSNKISQLKRNNNHNYNNGNITCQQQIMLRTSYIYEKYSIK